MEFPKDLKYTKTHEWVRAQGGVATCGLTAFAAEQIGDVVQLELPEQGQEFSKDEPVAVVESSKASEEIFAPVSGKVAASKASEEIFAPVSGKVAASNMDLEAEPEKVNESPYADGWMFRIEMSDESELGGLLDADAYARHVAEIEEE
jgi:glycine cleavage system H protein